MDQLDQKTICMIAYTFYEFDARVRREAESLVKKGFKVTCLTPRIGASRSDVELGGVRIRELNVQKYRGKSTLSYTASYLAFLCNSFLVCSRLLLREGIDAVHIHNVPDFLVFAAVLPRILGKKVVLDIHDSVPETFSCKFPKSSRLLFRLLCLEERLSSLLSHKVICVNHPQRDTLVRRGIPVAKTFVSLNAPDHRLFKPRAPQVSSNGNAFRLIYHGTMANRLGVDVIIRATGELIDRIPGVQLHLWGNGDDLPVFQRLATKLSLDGVVRFKPQGVPLPELPEKLVAMDLGVIGNRKSIATDLMLPVKLMEYVAMGIPVVAPRLRAIEHYFSDEMVTFYEPGNPQEMAQSILTLYNDAQQRQTQALKAQDFLEDYGWEKREGDLVNLYRSLLER